ncbi:MAG: redoxin family protein [Gemmatimonadetes bacterium]|nr:redoxin family protein [Gemmatimonadota bacterium]
MELLISASYAVLWVVVVAQTVILLGVVRIVAAGALPRRLSDTTQGSLAPWFFAVDLEGRAVSTDTIAGRLTALLFVSPSCPTCLTTLAELHAIKHKVMGHVLLVCKGSRAECGLIAARYGISPTIADESDELSLRFGVLTTPTAVIVDESGRIVSHGTPVHREDLNELLRRSQEVTGDPVSA